MWKVYAADDEGYIQEALQKLIDWKKMDCSLERVVSDGQELIDLIKTSPADIVITDIQMPSIDGIAVCKYLYENHPRTQVIILTAYSDFEYAKKAIKYSVCDYVLKISIVDELPDAIEKAIANLSRIESTQISARGGSLLEQVDDYIKKNYTRRFSLEEIADAMHVNASYLSRFYKNKTGNNLFDVICSYRIDIAKEYLEHTDMRAYEISEAIGFDDAGYFSKMFKKATGLSPKDYRRKKTDE